MTVYFPINNTEHKLIHSVYRKKVSIKKMYTNKKNSILLSPLNFVVLFIGSYLCHLKEFIFIDNFNHMAFSTLNIWRCKMLDTLIGAVYKHHTDLIPAGARLSNMIIKYPLENFHGFFFFFIDVQYEFENCAIPFSPLYLTKIYFIFLDCLSYLTN